MYPGVLFDASGGILSVTAQVIEAKGALLYLLCRTLLHRVTEAATVLEHSVGEKSNCGTTDFWVFTQL